MPKYLRKTGLLWILVCAAALYEGCKDYGADVSPAGPTPTVTSVIPDSAAVGDTVQILGTNFGAAQGSSTAAIGGHAATEILFWSATEIRAKVPAAAVTGTVSVSVGGRQSNAVSFKVLGTVAPPVSFASDIQPIFSTYGCTSCHGGSGGLFLTAGQSYTNLVSVQAQAGCTNLFRVLPGNADESVLYLRLSGSTCGSRMPKGGSAISSTDLNLVRTWINQGAQNN